MNIEHLRLWKNPYTGGERGVDFHLSDEWLNKLNGYKLLKLTSICEGHVGADNFNQKQYPILRFQIDQSSNRDKLGLTIESIVAESASPITTKIQNGWNGSVYYLDADCLKNRTTEQMEVWVSEWFESMVGLFGKIDLALQTEGKDI
jgi:hypothetical protein